MKNLRFPFFCQNTVDKLIKKANLAVVVGTSSWVEQFQEALDVSAGDDDDDEEEGGEEEDSEPGCCDYVMHFLTVFWKVNNSEIIKYENSLISSS